MSSVLDMYANFLQMAVSAIAVGSALFFRFRPEADQRTVHIGNREFRRDAMYGFGLLAMQGVMVQIVANSVNTLSGISLFSSDLVLSAYALSFVILVTGAKA